MNLCFCLAFGEPIFQKRKDEFPRKAIFVPGWSPLLPAHLSRACYQALHLHYIHTPRSCLWEIGRERKENMHYNIGQNTFSHFNKCCCGCYLNCTPKVSKVWKVTRSPGLCSHQWNHPWIGSWLTVLLGGKDMIRGNHQSVTCKSAFLSQRLPFLSASWMPWLNSFPPFCISVLGLWPWTALTGNHELH